MAMACWGQERLDAVDRTLALMPDFAPAYLVGAMVFVARQALSSAEQMAAKGAAGQTLLAALDSSALSERGGGVEEHFQRLACTGWSACYVCGRAIVPSRSNRSIEN